MTTEAVIGEEQNEQTGSYSFTELGPKAKRKALDDARDWYVDTGWWDCTYEDAVECAKCLGIEVEQRDIEFSGFWSQGDGASFSGHYIPRADAVQAIKAHAPLDEVLLKLAQRLGVVQTAVKLQAGAMLSCSVSQSSRYSHSGTMRVSDVVFTPDLPDIPYDADDDFIDQSDEIQDVLRAFADWIYKQLEAEYDYLTSDEYIAENLAHGDYLFDGDGDII